MLTLKCQECNNEFEAQRTSAKFCSPKCRVKFNSKSEEPKNVYGVEMSTVSEINKEFFKVMDEASRNEPPTWATSHSVVNTPNKPLDANRTLIREPNDNFSLLLNEFNDLVENAPKYEEIKSKLGLIKNTAMNSKLTPRQQDAILDRITFYKNGQYDLKPKSLKLT